MTTRRQSFMLYELVTVTGEVIYVGATTNIHLRLIDHRCKPWWPEVDHTRIRLCGTRGEMATRERELIFDLEPRYNTFGNPAAIQGTRGEISARLLAIVAAAKVPMSSTEIRAEMDDYANTSTMLNRLHFAGLIKPVSWAQGSYRGGYVASWALDDSDLPEVGRPVSAWGTHRSLEAQAAIVNSLYTDEPVMS